jgi:hypothetical protein
MVSILSNVFISLLTLTRIASFPDSNPTYSVLHVLPLVVTLPYTYKSASATLPPSVTADSNSSEKPQYVVSPSGHGSRHEDIIASCEALRGHVLKVQEDAQKTIKKWEDSVKEAELAEKRRVAPG